MVVMEDKDKNMDATRQLAAVAQYIQAQTHTTVAVNVTDLTMNVITRIIAFRIGIKIETMAISLDAEVKDIRRSTSWPGGEQMNLIMQMQSVSVNKVQGGGVKSPHHNDRDKSNQEIQDHQRQAHGKMKHMEYINDEVTALRVISG